MEYVCKYKNIADELKKRNPDCTVEIRHDLNSLVYMKVADNDAVNLCNEVLIALGYFKGPEIDLNNARLKGQEPSTAGAYYKHSISATCK